MEYDDVDVAKPLDRIFEDHIMEFESGSNRISDRELKKMMRDLDDYETGCQTKRRRNRE
ncbi:MAG: hypothetical protein ABSF20_07375 [Smithella sp.]|jgi:hypothetical protein